MSVSVSVTTAVARAAHLVTERTEQGLLQRLAEVAAELTGSCGSVAILLGADGSPTVVAHHGLRTEQVAMMRLLPRPNGLLASVLDGSCVRLDDWTSILGERTPTTEAGRQVARLMGSMVGPFLGVPVVEAGEVLGAVYVARSREAEPYSNDDALLVEALADQVGVLVVGMRRSNAADLLIARLGRGESGAEDTHALTGSVTVRRLLASVRRILGTQIAYLARIDSDCQVVVYVDRGTDAPDLREGGRFELSETYCALMLAGRLPASVPDLAARPETATLPITTELGAGSYCGVPVRLPDGSVYGTLCGMNGYAGLDVSATQLESLRVLADLVGVELHHQTEQAVEHERQLAAFACATQPSRRSIHLQPIVELGSRRTVGFEALTRFVDASGKPRRPDVVFDHASALGVGVALEQAVAAEALELLPMVPDDCYLSVNLSPQALTAPATFEMLTDAVAEHPGRLVVELTEHEEVSDYDALIAVFDGLRHRGLRLAIDDTGAGYASLQHVTRLRPDIVKLDIAFVRDIHLDAGSRAVARALTAFAADVGAQLVAEGIELKAEADELIRIGASYGQGYLYGRPEPAAVAVATARPVRPVRVQAG